MAQTGRTMREIFQKADIDINKFSREQIIEAFEEIYFFEDDIDFSNIS